MFLLLLSILLSLFLYKIIKATKYWQDRDVVHEPSWPIIGNLGSFILRKKHLMDVTIDLYNKYSTERYVGIMQLTQPMLMIRDPDLIKQLAIKEFDYFHDHYAYAENNNDPIFSKILLNLKGKEWREMRATLSPVFTGSKMRAMYQLMVESAQNFVGHFRGKEQVAVDMNDIFSRFATDVIATTVFGVKVDSLDKPKNSFFKMGNRVSRGILLFVRAILASKLPLFGKFVGMRLFPNDVTSFFRSIIKDNIAEREKSGVVRPDLIHLLMEARKKGLEHDPIDTDENESFATVEESHISQETALKLLTDDDIVAQAMVFFFAGFDTATTASCFMAHELATHPDAQQKLQEEVDSVNRKYGKKVSYETLLSMKYLDQVVCETLRMWPPGFQTDRLCTKEYTIQGEKPTLIEKGISILIPVIAIHRDPKYYPEPDNFDPERFSETNRMKIVPGTYIPFGVGPRNCIGSRFAILEMKTLFYHLITKFEIVPVTGTQIPLKISRGTINLKPVHGFRLGLRPRKVQ